MDLDQLHTFLEIVRLKSFSKAAQSVFSHDSLRERSSSPVGAGTERSAF